jgi:UDP-glucuronate 4-epimerase
MKYIVTGAAGFIGSQVAEQLVGQGREVVGIDCFTPYYSSDLKSLNVERLRQTDNFHLLTMDLASDPLEDILGPGDVIFHLAAQPGVRPSWKDFAYYLSNNVLATQRLLEAAYARRVARFVYSSSSSVYGNAPAFPTTEESPTAPESPYGATKKAAEDLVLLYGRRGVFDAVCLRYFTVYGPRQRPDMAIFRLINSALTGAPFYLYGDGRQVRDFTFVEDVVRANLLAAEAVIEEPLIVNIGGGSAVELASLVDLVGEICGKAPQIVRRESSPGDVIRTGSAIERASSELTWAPLTDLRSGLKRQAAWQDELTSNFRIEQLELEA